MDLIAILWVLVGAGALVFAADALLMLSSRRGHISPSRVRSTLAFSVLMLMFAAGTVILVVADRLT